MSMSTQMAGSVTFTAPMPGLEALTDFTLRPIPDAQGLYSLEGSGSFTIRLFLADAALFVPGYAPPFTRGTLADLELDSVQSGQVLVVVNPTEAGTTVNLMAPVVLNPRTGACTQVVLDGREFPLQHRLV